MDKYIPSANEFSNNQHLIDSKVFRSDTVNTLHGFYEIEINEDIHFNLIIDLDDISGSGQFDLTLKVIYESISKKNNLLVALMINHNLDQIVSMERLRYRRGSTPGDEVISG